MKIDKFSFLVFLLVLIFSCKKDDDFKQIAYPSSYHKSGIKIAGDLRVFSPAGEIRDPIIINRFIATDTLYYSQTVEVIGNHLGRMDTIKFSDAQHAMVNDRFYILNCLIEQKNGSLILSRIDTSTGYSSIDEFTHSLTYYIGEVKPEVYTEYLISSIRGNYLFGYTAREKFLLQESYGRLVAPEILFVQHDDQQSYGGLVNNILQNDFYKNIATGDTVTIREYLISYEKQ